MGLPAEARRGVGGVVVLGGVRVRVLRGGGGLGFAAERLVSQPAGGPRRRAVRIGLHRLVEVGGGFLGLVEREVTGRTAQQRLSPLRCQAIGGGEILDRLLVLVFALIDQAAAVQRLRVVGVERERAIEFREGFLGLAGFGQNLAVRGVALRVADAAGADIVGRFLRDRFRLFTVGSPRSQIERAAGKRERNGDRKQNQRRRGAAATRNSGGSWGNRNSPWGKCRRGEPCIGNPDNAPRKITTRAQGPRPRILQSGNRGSSLSAPRPRHPPAS